MCLVVSTLFSILQLNNHTKKVTFFFTFFLNYSQKWGFYNFFELPHGITQKNHDFFTFTRVDWRGDLYPFPPPIYPCESAKFVVFLCNTMRKFKKVVKISFLGIIKKKSGEKSNFFRMVIELQKWQQSAHHQADSLQCTDMEVPFKHSFIVY